MNRKCIETWSAYWHTKKESLVEIIGNNHIAVLDNAFVLVGEDGKPAPPIVRTLWFDVTLLNNFLNRPRRVVRIPALDCEALAHTEIRVPFECYRQPFPTIIVELPLEFARSNEFNCQYLPFDGHFGGSPLARPSFVILDCNDKPPYLTIMVVYENGHSFTTRLIEPSTTLEESLDRIQQLPVSDNLPPPSVVAHKT